MQIVLKYKSRLGQRGELVNVPDKDGQRLIKNGMATTVEHRQKPSDELMTSEAPEKTTKKRIADEKKGA